MRVLEALASHIIRYKVEEMEEQNQIKGQKLVSGELYLFHCTDSLCPADSSLFGVFDTEESGNIYLESSSWDVQHFRIWHRLPKDYHYFRLANRSELRDYMFNLACYERRQKEFVELKQHSGQRA